MTTVKKPRGRPRESADGGARKQRKVWLTDREHTLLWALAQQAGVSVSEWVRRAMRQATTRRGGRT